MSEHGWSREFLKLLSLDTLKAALTFADEKGQSEYAAYAAAIRAEFVRRRPARDPIDSMERSFYPPADPIDR